MDWKNFLKNSDVVVKLISVNVAVFVVLKLVQIILTLFNVSVSFLPYLAMPADGGLFLHRFWTLLTYMFMHDGLWHLFFNMLCLFWFGKIALTYLNNKQLIGLYLFGGILGGLFYILCYNIFPYYQAVLNASLLLGASGAIMAIIVAAAMLAPNMEIRLMFVGGIKLKWVAVITVLISMFGVTSLNAGGELAHIGGALAGYIFVVLLRKGKDVTVIFNRILDRLANLFRKSKSKKSPKFHYSKPMNDAEYNRYKAQKTADIDAILDKIKRSGYDSLNDEERKKLFEK